MDKLYSIAEISRLTGVPPSTIAYYRDKYQQYFPTIGKGKKRRYKEPVVEVVRLIADLSKNSRPQEEIESSLRSNFQQFHEVEEEHQHITSTNQQRADSIELLAKSLDRVADQSQQIHELRQEVEELKKMIQQQKKQSLWERLFKSGHQ